MKDYIIKHFVCSEKNWITVFNISQVCWIFYYAIRLNATAPPPFRQIDRIPCKQIICNGWFLKSSLSYKNLPNHCNILGFIYVFFFYQFMPLQKKAFCKRPTANSLITFCMQTLFPSLQHIWCYILPWFGWGLEIECSKSLACN